MLQLSSCYRRAAHPMASFDDLAVAHINESAVKLGIEMRHLWISSSRKGRRARWSCRMSIAHFGSSRGWSAAKRHHSLALTRDGTCLRVAGRGVEICMSPTFCVVETCSSTCCDLVTTWL